jgi:biopolymer transport protein ExbD
MHPGALPPDPPEMRPGALPTDPKKGRPAMAGTSLYQDSDEQAGITDINVTPFVDVVLVLLVVFIVTAKLIVARGVDIEKPKMAAGGDVQSTLRQALRQRRSVHR